MLANNKKEKKIHIQNTWTNVEIAWQKEEWQRKYTLYESIHIKLLEKIIVTEDQWSPKNGVGWCREGG